MSAAITAPLCRCPSCKGLGFCEDFVCCGQGDSNGCCGNPLFEEIECPLCHGSLWVSRDDFLDYALRTRNRALLAEHEAMLLMDSLPKPHRPRAPAPELAEPNPDPIQAPSTSRRSSRI